MPNANEFTNEQIMANLGLHAFDFEDPAYDEVPEEDAVEAAVDRLEQAKNQANYSASIDTLNQHRTVSFKKHLQRQTQVGHSLNSALSASTRRDDFAGKNYQELLNLLSIEASEESREKKIDYVSSKYAVPFHQDNTSRLKALMSNVGTGKSSSSIMELLRVGSLQPAAADGVRYSRTAVVRATFSQLENTTLATWRHWIPEKICRIKKGTRLTGLINQKLADGTTMHMEVIFMALDSDQWLDNLQGLEITFFWINEFVELRSPGTVLKHIMSRLGRYPSKSVSPIRWTGGLLDYNPPRIGSYTYNLFETEKKPDSFRLFKYDPPLLMTPDPEDPDDMSKATFTPNMEADYVRFQNLGYDYWLNLVNDFKSDNNYIRRMVLGEYTYIEDGNPVFPRFRHHKHVTETTPSINRKLLVGIDAGLTPAAVFAQLVDGALVVHDCITTDDCTFTEMWELYVEPLLAEDYAGFTIQVALDKGSDNKGEVDGAKLRKFLSDKLIKSWVSKDAGIQSRLDSVNWFLTRDSGFWIHPQALDLITGLSGGYRWKQHRGNSAYEDGTKERRTVPDKNKYSHVADALQAITMMVRHGAGYGNEGTSDYWQSDTVGSRSNNKLKQDLTRRGSRRHFIA